MNLTFVASQPYLVVDDERTPQGDKAMAVEKRWMSVREASEYLGLHLKSLYRACRRKQIPCSKYRGIGVRIDKKALDELLERRSVRPDECERELKGSAR